MAQDRGLRFVNHKLLKGSSILQESIAELLQRGRPVSVLEIGCGVGRALMELAFEFRHQPVSFAGINKHRGTPLSESADLLQTAADYAIGSADELHRLTLPALHFYDATNLHFEDESQDLVYLSSVLRFVPLKLELIAELCRVLRPGGQALVRVSSSGWDYPRGPVCDDALLTASPARLVLKHGGELIPVEAYLDLYADQGFDFEFINLPACVLKVTKREPGTIRFGASYEPTWSGSMKQMAYGDPSVGRAEGGFRSVYSLSADEYGRLQARDQTTRARAGSGTPRTSGSEKLAKNRERLLRYAVGQRVQIEGLRSECGRRFHVVKMKPVEERQTSDMLEGRLEAIDGNGRGLVVLGLAVDCSAVTDASAHDGEPIALGDLLPGVLIKVTGNRQGGRFVAERIKVQEQPAIVTEVIRAPIDELLPDVVRLRILGLEAITGEDCKIHAPRADDAR